MSVNDVETKALLPGIVDTLHEDSSSEGKDTLQMSSCLKEKKPLMVFVLPADI